MTSRSGGNIAGRFGLIWPGPNSCVPFGTCRSEAFDDNHRRTGWRIFITEAVRHFYCLVAGVLLGAGCHSMFWGGLVLLWCGSARVGDLTFALRVSRSVTSWPRRYPIAAHYVPTVAITFTLLVVNSNGDHCVPAFSASFALATGSRAKPRLPFSASQS